MLYLLRSSVSSRLFSPPSLVAVFPGPKNFRPPLCGGRLPAIIFTTSNAVRISALPPRPILARVLICHSWVSMRASDAPQRPQRPQRPLRGPSWITIWASGAPQRPLLDHNLGLRGLGLILGLGGWRTAVALFFSGRHDVAAKTSSKIFFRKKWQSKGLITPLHNTFSATKTVTFQPS